MKPEFLIDVREKDEFNAEFILGSLNFPLSTLNSSIDTIKSQSQNKKIIIICKSGNRANLALEQIKRTHTDADKEIELEVLEGGITAWRNSGNPTEVKKKFHLPIMRQVQLIVGGSVFFFSATTLITLNTSFSIIPLIFGAGLAFAGLSGWCGLALALAKMPWNKEV